MPLQLSDLKAKIRKIPIDYDGDIVNIEYCPQEFSPEFIDRIKTPKPKGLSESDSWVPLLDVLKGWDLVDGDAPAPLNEKTLATMGNRLLMAIFLGIQADSNPNQMSGGTSAAGSLRKDK
jgi:hypothetical protein